MSGRLGRFFCFNVNRACGWICFVSKQRIRRQHCKFTSRVNPLQERDVIRGLTKQDNLVLRFCVVFLCKMEWCFIVAQVGMCFDFSRHWASILPGDRFNSMQLGSGVSLQHNL